MIIVVSIMTSIRDVAGTNKQYGKRKEVSSYEANI